MICHCNNCMKSWTSPFSSIGLIEWFAGWLHQKQTWGMLMFLLNGVQQTLRYVFSYWWVCQKCYPISSMYIDIDLIYIDLTMISRQTRQYACRTQHNVLPITVFHLNKWCATFCGGWMCPWLHTPNPLSLLPPEDWSAYSKGVTSFYTWLQCILSISSHFLCRYFITHFAYYSKSTLLRS